jgi:hypothetical protein
MIAQLTSVSDVASALRSGSCAKETEDRVLDVIWVVQEEVGVDNVEDVPVRVLLRHLTLLEGKRSRASDHGADESKGDD